ncbi:hypothetical protein [Metabacillus litoralis]|nr:hypothetical protein [Metabacillus litoralis]
MKRSRNLTDYGISLPSKIQANGYFHLKENFIAIHEERNANSN